jgi:hypothetical protein
MSATTIPIDDLKATREALCLAEAALLERARSGVDVERAGWSVARIGRLIAEIDVHRPLGADGKHGDLHPGRNAEVGSTVYRLPEEPPIGTTVRSPSRASYTRTGSGWERANPPGAGPFDWSHLLHSWGELTVVEPDPHPTPWRVGDDAFIEDADGKVVAVPHRWVEGRRAVAERIVKAVNEAVT